MSVLCPSAVDTKVLEAERNRPGDFGAEARTELAESMRVAIADTMTGPSGKTPDDVAAIVVDAIRNDRFWIITHPGERPSLEARFADILDNRRRADQGIVMAILPTCSLACSTRHRFVHLGPGERVADVRPQAGGRDTRAQSLAVRRDAADGDPVEPDVAGHRVDTGTSALPTPESTPTIAT